MHTAGSKETCHMLELESKGNPTVLEPVILGVIHIVIAEGRAWKRAVASR